MGTQLNQLPRLESEEPIQSDVTAEIPLEEQIARMEKPQLIKYLESLGFNVDARLKEETIRENILKIVADRKDNAYQLNRDSSKATISEDDPMIKVKFFNLESPGADESFSFPGKRGMYGPQFKKDGKTYGNPNGHRKCPKYHLFPGEEIELAYSVYDHLTSLTFMTHKTVFEPITGMIQGNIPIIKPRFILQPILTKEDILKINKNR